MRGPLIAFSQDPYVASATVKARDVTHTRAAALGMGSTGYP